MKIFSKKAITLCLGFAFLGAACENVPEVYKGALELPKPVASLATTSSHTVNFSGQSQLSQEAKNALDAFIYTERLAYGDELLYDFAAGDANWPEKQKALDDFLKTRGVWANGVIQSGNNSNPSTVNFVVNRYSVSTPDCQALSRESFVPTELENNKILGCITAHNLGAHVANPKDFIQGQPDTPPVAEASTRAVALYRARFGSQIRSVNTGNNSGN